MTMNYPSIDIEQLRNLLIIVESAASDEKYLNPESCPYDSETVAMIRAMITACQLNSPTEAIGVQKGKRGRPKKNPLQDTEELNKELDELRLELRQMKLDGKDMANSDRIQIFKVRAGIIDKMLSMKERIINMNQQARFIETVISLMHDHFTQEQREAFMKELKPFADGES